MPKSTQIGFYIVQIFCILFIIYWVQLIFYKSDTNKNIIVYSNYTTFYGIESAIEWKDVPSVTILCRIYSGSAMEFYNVFIVSYLLFWPYNSWRNSDIVAIMDDENEEDHRLGNFLFLVIYALVFRKFVSQYVKLETRIVIYCAKTYEA
jgi:hypothetical protein